MPRSDLDYRALEFGEPSKPKQTPERQEFGRRMKWLTIGFVVVALILVGGPYLYFHVIEGSAPAPLHLPTVKGAAAQPLAPGPVTGTWQVAAGSQAGYRVEEVLFDQHHTAVGRTTKVSGGMVISGARVTAAEFTVDLKAIRSDQASRDVQFNGFIMETYAHPDATFRLSSPIQLGVVPAQGTAVTEPATGMLTMRGVTQPVGFVIHAERVAGGIDLNAEIPVTFSRWHIPNPSFAVAQVGSTGTVEVLLHMVPGHS